MSTPDHGAHGLAAAYAMDALEESERSRMDDHLQHCADCRRDVQEFRETAARLAEAETREPPPGLWERLSRTLPNTRQLPPTAEAPADQLRSRRGPRSGHVAWAVAAAALLAAMVVSGIYAEQRERFIDLAEHQDRIDAIIASADSAMSAGRLGEDARATIVSSQDHDMAVVVVEGLPSPPDGMVYQMWYLDDAGGDGEQDVRPAGMLEPSAEDGMQSGICTEMGSAAQLGVTMEPDGGMSEPSGDPMTIDVYQDDGAQGY